MLDPFGVLACIVSALVLPGFLFVLFLPLRRSTIEHRQLIARRYRHRSAWHAYLLGESASDATALTRLEAQSIAHVTQDNTADNDQNKVINQDVRAGADPDLELSHLPQTFDKVLDAHNTRKSMDVQGFSVPASEPWSNSVEYSVHYVLRGASSDI